LVLPITNVMTSNKEYLQKRQRDISTSVIEQTVR